MENLKPNRSENRGGKRENAGRKPRPTKQFNVRCKPENILKIRKWVKENDF